MAYDDASKDSVTLGGSNGTQIHNVAAGTADQDAVNLDQLTKAGLKVGSDGTPTNSFVAYDDASKDSVTLGGSNGTQIHNVAAGTADQDAVNLDQLTKAGLKVDSTGTPTNSFVAYDDLSKGSVTLGGIGATKTVVLTNVAPGALTPTSTDAVNGSQLYNTVASTAAALGGGSVPKPDGTVGEPTYTVAGADYHDVGSAIDATSKQVASALKYVKFGATDALDAAATGTDAVAIGGYATSNGAHALAIGSNSVASGSGTVAIGYGSVAFEENTVSFGSVATQRRLTNVAAGTGETDAVNLGQVETLIADAAKTTTTKMASLSLAAPSTRSFANPSSLAPEELLSSGPTDKAGQIEAIGTDAIAIGLNVHAINNQTVAIGTNVSAAGIGSVAIGNSAVTTGVNATAIGVNAIASAGNAPLAIGYQAQSGSDNSLVIGNKSFIGDGPTMKASNSISLGNSNTILNTNSVAVGNANTVTGAGSFVLGNNTKVAGTNSVILGAGSDGSQSNVISVGAAGAERKIVNVATGVADTDAVNVKQLNDKVAGLSGGGSSLVTQAGPDEDVLVASATGGTHVNFAGTSGPRELTGVANGTGDTSAATVGQLKPAVAALGGGAGVAADGSVTGPTYHVQGGTQNTVGTALDALDGGLNSLKDQIDGAGLGLVAQDPKTKDITVGKDTDGSLVNVAGKDGNRKVSGVANGAVSQASVDAINGSQLFGTAQSIASAFGGGSMVNPDGTLKQPTFQVGGTSYHNVGEALTNLDGRTAQNTGDITNIKNELANIGGGQSNPNAISYDSSAHDKATLGSEGNTALVTNLTDATLSATSTDAVTGKQLFATNQEVASLGDALKNISTAGLGGIAMGPTDSGLSPVATAAGPNSIAIGDGANASGSGGVAMGTNSVAGGKDTLALGNGAQASSDNSVALGAHSVADQPNTVSVGSEGNERRVTNVAPGINGTDAVNMNQLGQVQSGLNDVARKSYGGIAAATALTMIPDVDANKTLSVGIGGGTYRGYAATAIGGTARITQNLKVRVGAGWSSGGTTVGAGASYQW
ncbi:YadA-like family protein [Caballeronia sp. LZ024]|uniref:YadA family autotransporter adhesin n=1 Tax=Caballeronia sp. LZ024 TaxID=3038561 RepID=UPI00285D316D|nr:YadA-like family protein [Caballeronia sp. LZ024]MDR5751627.1 YadA-like family protein [Caballeronia sp. LZ024]